MVSLLLVFFRPLFSYRTFTKHPQRGYCCGKTFLVASSFEDVSFNQLKERREIIGRVSAYFRELKRQTLGWPHRGLDAGYEASSKTSSCSHPQTLPHSLIGHLLSLSQVLSSHPKTNSLRSVLSAINQTRSLQLISAWYFSPFTTFACPYVLSMSLEIVQIQILLEIACNLFYLDLFLPS